MACDGWVGEGAVGRKKRSGLRRVMGFSFELELRFGNRKEGNEGRYGEIYS